MTTRDEILKSFEFVNVSPSEAVLVKCLELCNDYFVEPEDLVDRWFAYTASNLNGVSPTVETLEKFERKEFQKQNKERTLEKTPVRTPKSISKTNTVIEESAIPSYSAETPKSQKNLSETSSKDAETTPNRTTALRNSDESLIQNSPSAQVEKYADRKDPLSVKLTHETEPSSVCNEDIELFIKNCNSLDADLRYMYEVMGRKASCLNGITQWVAQAIAKKHNLVFSDNSLKHYTGEMTTFGRICIDSGSKLNVQSILLEGTQQLHMGHTVGFNINKVPRCALFPGQVVVTQGNNLNGNTFIAEKIFTDGSLELPEDPPVTKDPLHIIIASGPFTLQENLSYEPLKDLLTYTVDNRPNVLILMGPFLEAHHPGIHDGTLTESFDSFFESLVQSIAVALEDTNIQIVFVSSIKDVHHHAVYPTPPYKIREKHKNVHFFSDPCMLNINGLIIGATTVDILFHLGKEELVVDKVGSSDRITRLASHILQQQSFYPLYPPSHDVNVSHELLEEHGIMECLPHILILPSTFRYYVKKINDCIILNPEKLTKGYVAGTFSRVVVNPGSSRSVANRISCKIIRI